MAERLGNLAINQKVAGSIPGRAKMTLCPWALHPTCLGWNVPVLYYTSLWIRASAKGLNVKRLLSPPEEHVPTG